MTFDHNPVTTLIRQATYPEINNTKGPINQQWLNYYLHKITIEDPQHLYKLEKAAAMPMLLQSLANRAGSLVNDSQIAQDININTVTARTYRHLLEKTFIINAVEPWFRNVNKRLVKTGKVFFYDTLLLAHLRRHNTSDLSKTPPHELGHLFENFVWSELTKLNALETYPVNISFFRTREGVGVDFVLETYDQLVGIEVKHAETISSKDLHGLRELKSLATTSFTCGIVLCNTKRVIEIEKDIFLVPFSALWA